MEADAFSETTFADLIQAGILEIGDGYRAKLSELGGSGSIFLRAGHVTDQGINFAGVERFSVECSPALRSKTSRPGDVVVTTKGNSIGRTAYVTSEMPEFVYSPHLSFWRSHKPARLVPGFLRYWANGLDFIGQLDGMKASTDMAPYLSLSDQRRLKLTLPDGSSQKAIAAVLEALDQKIVLNRRMNGTLEAIAQAIFKSWFVDFDPVTAKAVGRRLPGMDSETASLFPAGLRESDAGRTPAGWHRGSVYEVSRVIYGATFASRLFNRDGRGLPLIRIRDLGTHAPEVFTDEQHPNGTRIRAGDIVVGMDGEFRAHVWRGPESWLNQRVCHFRPRNEAPVAFVFFSILEPLADIERGEVGTTVSHLGKADIDEFRIVIPEKRVLTRFAELTTSLMERILANAAESRTIALLRDTLLPKLLTGEIRVREAEKLAERAGA